jgi:hypothetical protein
VSSIQDVLKYSRKGHWADVIEMCRTFELPRELLEDIYEEMYLDVFEKGDVVLCKEILDTSQVMIAMRSGAPISQIRYKRLNTLLTMDKNGRSDVRQGMTKSERREAISNQLAQQLCEMPKSRLVTLIRAGLAAGATEPSPTVP